MKFYVYVSDLTHRRLVFFIDKGKTFAMPDGEVFDKEAEYGESHFLSANCVIHISEDGDVNVCKVSDLN